MTKDEYGDLLAEIGGGNQIGIASRRERNAAEQRVLAEHDTKFWGLLCLGDAVHEFYRDTLDVVSQQISRSSITNAQFAMVNWHIVSFGRFAAAFHLMAHGYYFEAITLARDLWEVALSLAAVRRGVVTLDELVGAGASTRREMEELSRKADTKIRRTLIWENTRLREEGREAVETFLGIANLATHKSKLHLTLNFSNIIKQRPVSIFPQFDLERAGAAHNMLSLASWSLVSTLPYLDFALPSSARGWHDRYAKIQLAFREGPGKGPNAAVKAWSEVIERVFVPTQ